MQHNDCDAGHDACDRDEIRLRHFFLQKKMCEEKHEDDLHLSEKSGVDSARHSQAGKEQQWSEYSTQGRHGQQPKQFALMQPEQFVYNWQYAARHDDKKPCKQFADEKKRKRRQGHAQ